jgi:Cu/Ag efflux protein CusF
MMKKILILLAVVVFGLTLAVGAMAEEKKQEKNAKPSGMKERTIKRTATVQAIDLEKRVVTLKGEKGNVFDLKVGEEAKNLPQVKVGDLVTVQYYESLAFEVTKPGQAVAAGATTGVASAKPGEKPAGVAAGQVTITATVEAIDAKNHYVTLKGPDGKTKEIKVKDPKNLVNVKVGDQVAITYTEALAIQVEPAKKKK